MAGIFIPPGTTIAAGGYLTVYADTNPGAAPGIWLGFNLKAEGDDLRLFDPVQTATPLDSIVFGIQLTDHSIGRRPDAPFVPPAGARLAVQHGFSLHAGVRISGSDRERLERLVRYVARLEGIDESTLGQKGKSGVLKSMATRQAFADQHLHDVLRQADGCVA